MKKRLKKKKISGKRWARILERKCRMLSDALDFQKKQIERQHNIIRHLGSKDGYEFLDIADLKTIEAKEKVPKTYGNYGVITYELTEEIIKQKEEQLVTALVRNLIEANAIQFIVKLAEDSNYPLDFNTIAAKIRVVPWYEVVKQPSSKSEGE